MKKITYTIAILSMAVGIYMMYYWINKPIEVKTPAYPTPQVWSEPANIYSNEGKG